MKKCHECNEYHNDGACDNLVRCHGFGCDVMVSANSAKFCAECVEDDTV